MSSTRGSTADGAPNKAVGDTIIVRYADEMVVGLQDRRNAGRFLGDLRDRLAQFGLGLHPDKTRLLKSSRCGHA